jgi:phosphinothricin acetyltransferase
MARIYAPSVSAAVISFETDPPDAAEMQRRLASTMPQHPWLVCDVGGTIAGYAYASKHHERAAYRWSVNVSVYVDERCRRAVVGRGLYASLFAILSAQGYIKRLRGYHAAQPGKRRPARGGRLQAVRCLPERRVQVRCLARRWLVAAHPRGAPRASCRSD